MLCGAKLIPMTPVRAGNWRQHRALLLDIVPVSPCLHLLCISLSVSTLRCCSTQGEHHPPVLAAPVWLPCLCRYQNRVVAKLPFHPPGLLRKVVHRGLEDPEIDDCALVSRRLQHQPDCHVCFIAAQLQI